MGALPSLLRDPAGFITSARARYGDIYTLDLGATQCILLNHPRHVHRVLRENARNYTKGGPVWGFLRMFTGNGLPTSDGELWLRQRRMLQPKFHKEYLISMMGLMVEAIDESLVDWNKAAESGKPFDAAQAIARMTMNVVVKTMFGADISQEEANLVNEELSYAFGYLVPGMVSNSLPSWVPFPGRRRFQQTIKTVDEIVFRLIDRRRRGEKVQGGDLISMMLAAVDDETGKGMTDQQLRDEAVSTFIAGYETTSSAVAFALACLAERPEIAKALREECDSVLGDAAPSLSHLSGLQLTNLVLQETMRLYPPAYWTPRTATEDDVIDGYRIPAGTMVGVMTYVIHRHPELWQEPEKFDPWRFLPERSAGRNPLAYIPFGTGQRQCIGRDLSIMEGQIILARVVSRFEFEFAPGYVLKPEVATTLRPRGGVLLQLRKRATRTIAAVG